MPLRKFPAMLISNSFDDLSQSLRVLLEANYRAHGGGLLNVDRAEAVGNIEMALAGVLNAFHSLYDAMQKERSDIKLNWYEHGELAFILVLRNARHHNHANKVRTLYSYHAQEAPTPSQIVQYVLIDFPPDDPTATNFDVYVSWADILDLFALPDKTTRLKASTKFVIEGYLNSGKFAEYAEVYQLSERQVFLNLVPLFVNAGIKVTAKIADVIYPNSTEAKSFKSLFSVLGPAKVSQPNVNCGPIALPE